MKHFGPRWKLTLAAVGIVLIVGLLLTLILPFTGSPWLWHVKSYINPSDSISRAYLVQAQIQASSVLVEIVGGAFFFLGIYYTARTLRLNQEGQITDRYTRAVEQLGSENVSVRVGAVYALERIARDSDRDYWVIMEVLAAYIRHAVPWPIGSSRSPYISSRSWTDPPDVYAALKVIGRRRYVGGNGEDERINLRETDLRKSWLRDAFLEQADLSFSHLDGSYLRHANLARASLRGAHLRWALLSEANLAGADLGNADLRETIWDGTKLDSADLRGADLRSVKGLTQAQIDQTFMDEKTLLSDEPGPGDVPLQRSKRQG